MTCFKTTFTNYTVIHSPGIAQTCPPLQALLMCVQTYVYVVINTNYLFSIGRYNNQWMIVDYNKFNIGKNITNGTLWIVEQIPWVTSSLNSLCNL